MAKPQKLRVTIDRGGTFCDIWASVPDHPDIVIKLLSEDPENYKDAPTEGVRRVLEIATKTSIPKDLPLDGSPIEWIRVGTTVATNALLERKGEKFALLVTEGFKDVCEIGTQARPKLFDLNIRKPGVLHDKVVEVKERVTIEDFTLNPHPMVIDVEGDENLVRTSSGEIIRIIEKLDEEDTKKKLQNLRDEGFQSVAVCLMHSYAFPDHEHRIAKLAKDIGFGFVSVSSALSPNIKIISRARSSCADAYLSPHIKRYVDGFMASFSKLPNRVEFMQSDGGLTVGEKFSGLKAILSGPAGGVVAIASTCYDPTEGTPVIGFDMGGTSTDVSRFDKNFEHVFDTTISGTTIVAPMLDVKTVAAGGGSILFWRSKLFVVGPESAGAHPGPACYRKGGPLTITDANLFLGRLIPESFPSIFGPHANEPLDINVVKEKFQQFTEEINRDLEVKLTPEEVASGFIHVANETMSRPIRSITEARGFATNAHNLVTFGGAGGQHACAIARSLGIPRIIIHKYSSILSAYGIGLANIVSDLAEPASYSFSDSSTLNTVDKRLESLRVKVKEDLASQGISSDSVEYQNYLSLRYEGTDTNITILQPEDKDYAKAFIEQHRREFAFGLERPVVVDSIRVRGVGKGLQNHDSTRLFEELKDESLGIKAQPIPSTIKEVYFDAAWSQIPVYLLQSLVCGQKFSGPALIIDDTQTIFVEPNSEVFILTSHVVIQNDQGSPKPVDDDHLVVNPVQLSMFGHRFMSIAEQMGNTLQRTSISTSIKERLDFSCAIFSADAKLVANAPHIPIHLGSMQFAIQYQHKLWEGKLSPGDVLLTNHPSAGGTHLPDLTAVTPIFSGGQIIFYVASRGHHTDIGGIGITSMVPDSKELWQEGISIKSMRIVSGGHFEELAIREAFQDVADNPGCSASRRINDNISDLKAQVSANERGANLLQQLCQEYGVPYIQFYMHAIQANAEESIRTFLKESYKRVDGRPIKATDFYDDGTAIKLTITINGEDGSAIFDFTGTGAETYGNMNSPISITHSAVIYCLRCMIDLEIPLNQGCLNPITIIVPSGTILNPSEFVAICGSTIASQRVSDVIFKAFESCAASQGCGNSFGWGTGGKDPLTGQVTPGWNYGEALGGGSGAGPGWHGASGVNVHSTNTRTTDPEVIEKRTQVIVRKYELRAGTGGNGLFCGGQGVTREIEARMPLKFSILSERRVYSPYGMKGGEDGSVGVNYWLRKLEDGNVQRINLGGKAVVNVRTGDRVQINTPGGGGWGRPSEEDGEVRSDSRPVPRH